MDPVISVTSGVFGPTPTQVVLASTSPTMTPAWLLEGSPEQAYSLNNTDGKVVVYYVGHSNRYYNPFVTFQDEPPAAQHSRPEYPNAW